MQQHLTYDGSVDLKPPSSIVEKRETSEARKDNCEAKRDVSKPERMSV